MLMNKTVAMMGLGARFPGAPDLSADRRWVRARRVERSPLPAECRDRAQAQSENPRHAIMNGAAGLAALRPAPALGKRRITVQPSFFPAAEGRRGRRRFFVTAYSDARLRTADTLAEERAALGAVPGEARA
jgi:hypothetical protein